MGAIGFLALAANITSFLLMKYKDGDANERFVWLCSRNDAIGNVAVMIAAAAVWFTASKPHLIVAGLMASLFLSSAFQINPTAPMKLIIELYEPTSDGSREQSVSQSPVVAEGDAVMNRSYPMSGTRHNLQ
jgi:Co/Zn/Cd efflux system component